MDAMSEGLVAMIVLFLVPLICSALDLVLDSRTTSTERKKAENLLAEIKESDRSLQIAFHLVNAINSFPANARLFGLLIIEHQINANWKRWSSDQQLSLLNQVLLLVSSGMKGNYGEESHPIKEKLSKIIVSIALRTWPGQWTEFWATMESFLCSEVFLQVELSLLVLTQFIEESYIFSNPFLTTVEMENIRFFVPQQSRVFWPSFITFMMSKHNLLMVAKSTNSGELPSRKYIFILGLGLCAAFMEFISQDLILQTSFTHLLSAWLPTDQTCFLAIIDILDVLVKKSFSNPDDQAKIWKPIMGKLEDIRISILTLSNDPFKDSNYDYLKKIAEFVCELGTHQVCSKKSLLSDEEEFAEFLNLVMFLLSSECDYLSGMTLSFWLGALKQEKLYRNCHFLAIIQQLISIFSAKFFQASSMNLSERHLVHTSTSLKSKFAEVDFDSADEYALFISCIKTKLVEIFRCISRVKPYEMALHVVNSIEAFSKISYMPNNAEYFLQLETTINIMDAVLSSIGDISTIFPSDQTNSPLKKSLAFKFNSVISTLMSFNIPDSACLTKIISGIISCSLFMKDSLDNIFRLYNHLIPMVSISAKNANGITNEGLIELKRCAAGALVKIAATFSTQLMTRFDEISQQVQVLLSSDNLLGLSEKSSLIEFLLIIVQSSGSEAERSKCYEFVFLPVFHEWSNNQSISKFSSSYDSFFDVCGLSIYISSEIRTNDPVASGLKTRICASEDARSSLLYLINVSLVILKKLAPSVTSMPQAEHATSILLDLVLPNILAIIKNMHTLWRVGLDGPLAPILSFSEEEKRVLITGSKYARGDSNRGAFESLELALRIWLNSLRVSLYSIIQASSQSKGLFYKKVSVKLFISSILEDLSYLQLRFYKQFIVNIVEPCILNCPSEYFDTFLSYWPSQLVSYMAEFISSQWIQYEKCDVAPPPMCTSNDDDTTGEDTILLNQFVFERILRQASHSFASLLFNICVPIVERASLVSKTHDLGNSTQLLQFFFSNEFIYQKMIRSIFVIFHWKDSVVCNKAISICQRLIAMLGTRQEFTTLLCTELLGKLINVLKEDYHADNHESVISLIMLQASTFTSIFEKQFLNYLFDGDSRVAFQQDFPKFLEASLKEDNKLKKNIFRPFLEPFIYPAKGGGGGGRKQPPNSGNTFVPRLKELQTTGPWSEFISKNPKFHMLFNYPVSEELPSAASSMENSNDSLGLTSFFS